MIRYCFSTVSQVKAVQKEDGKWAVEGLGSDRYEMGLQHIQRLLQPFNSSFFMTPVATECLHRLSTNQSDVSNAYITMDTLSGHYFVPEVFFAGKVSFVTGYNISINDTVGEETATALGNVRLLELHVYLCSLILILSFISFIVTHICLFSPEHHRRKMPLIRVEMSALFYCSSDRYKSISLLYSVLCFYIVTSFLCLYKTSHVITEKPFYPKTYQESLEHKTSLAFFNDQFADVSETFKSAPVDSIRGKLWAKSLASGRKDAYQTATLDPMRMGERLAGASDEMTVRKGIAVASPLSMPLVLSIACGSSPENELWILKVLYDHTEKEIIYGPPVARSFQHSRHFAQRFRRSVETHIALTLYRIGLNLTPLVAQVLGTSDTHRWKQRVVCEHEDAFTPEVRVAAIPLSYFHSLLSVCFFVWSLAFLINCLQRAFHTCVQEESRKMRQRMLSQMHERQMKRAHSS